MQPNQENNVPNRPVVTRRPINANARPAGNTAARVPVDAGPTFDNGPSVVGSKGGRKTGWVLAIILLLLIAAGSVGFGVWAYMDGNNTKNSLNAQINTLQKQNSELQTQIDNLAGTISVDTDGNEVNTADYIYVGEWGIKIKIPEGLKSLSYIYQDGRILKVTGVAGESGNLPDFADISLNSDGLAGISRVAKSDYEEDRCALVFSDGDYNYCFYQTQYVYSTNEDMKELETESLNLIKNMMMNSENYSNI